jgi:hypothetical protein
MPGCHLGIWYGLEMLRWEGVRGISGAELAGHMSSNGLGPGAYICDCPLYQIVSIVYCVQSTLVAPHTMAETAELAVGVIALARLFNNAVQCFEFIQLGRALGRTSKQTSSDWTVASCAYLVGATL